MTAARAALLGAAGVSVGEPPPPPPPASWPGHVPGKVYLGTSEIATRTTQNTVQEIGQDLGLEREYYINYSSATEEDAFIEAAHSRNRIPWLSYKPSQNDATIQSDWAAINSGTQDAIHTARANRYNAFGKPVIITWSPQPERNATTLTLANSYRSAWKRLAGIYATRENVAFVPIFSDKLWHGDIGTDHWGDETWWVDDAMLDAMDFLGIRTEKNPGGATYADRLPMILDYLDGRGYSSLMIGLGLTQGYTTTNQSAAEWWNIGWNWIELNINRIGAVAYHNTNADPPPPEEADKPLAPTNLRITAGPTDTSVTFAWDVPVSAMPVLSYKVFRNGVLLKTVTTPSSGSITGLTAGTTYSFTVSATSQNGEGPQSSPLLVQTTGGSNPPPPGSVIIYAAGDIGQMEQYQAEHGQQLTGPIIDADKTKSAVLALGDLAYTDGTLAEFNQNYHPFWGMFKAQTKPVPGNHEYKTAGAGGYLSYFGSAQAKPQGQFYYSYDIGAWHFIALDSTFPSASTQLSWLDNDIAQWKLRKATVPGLLMYWHHARWTSIVRETGSGAGTSSVQTFVDRAVAAKADLIVAAHDHAYERFDKLNAAGQPTAGGTRHFVIGTGGRGFYFPGPVMPGSQYRLYSEWGVVKFTLTATDYTWQWKPGAGQGGSDTGTAAINPK